MFKLVIIVLGEFRGYEVKRLCGRVLRGFVIVFREYLGKDIL